jgi:hypothetical protein
MAPALDVAVFRALGRACISAHTILLREQEREDYPLQPQGYGAALDNALSSEAADVVRRLQVALEELPNRGDPIIDSENGRYVKCYCSA